MNRSDEVKIKDLPIAEQFNDNDHMIIDDGTVARKFKMGTLQEQLQTNIQVKVDENVSETLNKYDTTIDNKITEFEGDVNKQLTDNLNNVDTKMQETLTAVDNKLEASSLPFYVKDGQLLVRVWEDNNG